MIKKYEEDRVYSYGDDDYYHHHISLDVKISNCRDGWVDYDNRCLMIMYVMMMMMILMMIIVVTQS